MKIEVNEYVTEHFKLSDCVCPCCDRIKIVPGFFKHMELLERMIQELGFPIIINSGYHCPEYNKNIGGSPKSWHMLFATDIRPEEKDSRKLLLMYRMAIALDFGGIGYYENHIHLDMRPEKGRWRG